MTYTRGQLLTAGVPEKVLDCGHPESRGLVCVSFYDDPGDAVFTQCPGFNTNAVITWLLEQRDKAERRLRQLPDALRNQSKAEEQYGDALDRIATLTEQLKEAEEDRDNWKHQAHANSRAYAEDQPTLRRYREALEELRAGAGDIIAAYADAAEVPGNPETPSALTRFAYRVARIASIGLNPDE